MITQPQRKCQEAREMNVRYNCPQSIGRKEEKNKQKMVSESEGLIERQNRYETEDETAIYFSSEEA